jgi:uncharacterized protein involved in outer membrane biogenesis
MMAAVRRLLILALVVFILLPLGVWVAARRALASDLARATLERQLTNRLGRPVRVESAAASIFPDIAVELRDVTVGEAPPIRIGRIRIVTGLRSLFTRTLADTNIRTLAFRDLVLGTGDLTLAIDVDASITGDRLDVPRLTARARATRIVAAGALTSLSRMEGAFDVKADPLDLAELMALGSAIAPPGASGGHQAPMRLVLRVTAPATTFGAYRLGGLSTRAELVPGRFALDDLAFQIFGGRFRGRLGADTRDGASVLRLSGEASGLDVTQVLRGSGSPGGVTGRLAASLAVQAGGDDAASLLRTARGTVSATIADGTLPHLDLVRRIVLAFGKPSGGPPEGAGTAFKSLGGNFALANATLTSDNLTLTSRDLDAGGRGSFNLETGHVDARADVVLSRELTAQSGTDLRRYAQENGRVIVPAVVTGRLDAPSVSIDVAAAARRALGNELKRRATDFLGGLFKKKKGGG